MKPRVTIGIPCFNSEQWLEQAIASALAQTWPEKEVIVVDDGSTDRSREIAHGFDGKILFFSASHRGANHARNEVLRNASGEWVQYLDADDCLLPEKIARQIEEAEGGEDCDVIYSPVLIDENSKQEVSAMDPELDLYARWISWQLPQTGGCLWRRAVLDGLGGWNEGMPCCQEHELYLRALKAGLRFQFTPTANAVYRIWSDTTLCRRDPRQVVTIRTGLIDDMIAWMEKSGLWTEGHRLIAGRACFEMARTIAKFDLKQASAYHRERRRRGLIHLDGPAAPANYRKAYSVLGFGGAEKLARAMR